MENQKNGYIELQIPKNCCECIDINGMTREFCKRITGNEPVTNIETRPDWCPIMQRQNKTLYYAGIGSRETPWVWAGIFEDLAAELSKLGFVLRSGHATGADQSFESGCDSVNGPKEIYLPWKNFGGSDSSLIVKNEEAFEIAKKYHPNWCALKPWAKKIMARNSHQVLGKDLKTKSSFIVCYTPYGLGGGGTGQALRIAKDYNIKVFDAGKYEVTDFDDLSDEEVFVYEVLKYAKEIRKSVFGV